MLGKSPPERVNTDMSSSSDEEVGDLSTNLQHFGSPNVGLARSHTLKSSKEEVALNMRKFTLNAEGIADNKVTGIVADEWLKNTQMCLFRIETPSTISAATGGNKLEKKANKVTFKKSQGLILKYGQEVQLRHVHSDRFLCLNLLSAANTPGAWSVTVNEPNPGLCRQITLLPFNRSHNIGDPIMYDEPVSIVFQTENLKYFLQSRALSDELLDINATHKPASWKFTKFERHDESVEAIRFGELLTIKYQKLAMSMALQKPAVRPFKSSRRTASGIELLQAMMRKSDEVCEEPPRVPIVTKSEIEDYSHYWVLQNAKVMIGGAVSWKSKFYIKNALTGQFMGQDMKLHPRPDPNFPFFFPRPDSFSRDSLVPNGYPLMIKCSVPDTEEIKAQKQAIKKKAATAAGSGKSTVPNLKKAIDDIDNDLVLTPDSHKSNEEALDHLVPITGSEAQWESGEIGLTLDPLGPDQRESLFEFEYVSEQESIFFNLINSLYPKFHEMRRRLEEHNKKTESSARQSWETTEELERLLETMLSALEKVTRQIREAQGDLLESMQKIFAGLNFHAVLIEIAAILHTSFDEFTHPEVKNEEVLNLTKKVLEDIWSLMNDVAQENELSSKKIAEHRIYLCELLHFDTRRIGSLLTEVYRLVDPEIKDPKQFYSEWCAHLNTLSKQNLQEQVIYMRIIRNLCEVGDIGLLEYQTEIAKCLFKSENAIDLVAIGMYHRQYAVRFGAKGGVRMTVEEFKRLNPSLAQYVRESPEGHAIVLMQDLSQMQDYAEYVQTALLLYHSICRGRCEMARNFVSDRLGISINSALMVAQNLNVHIDIRHACMLLIEALCITVPPYEPYSEQDTSFSYADIKMLEGNGLIKQPLFSGNIESQSILDCLRIVFEFWMTRDIPQSIADNELLGILNYLLAMLRLTHAVVEYKHCTELYAFMVLRAVQYLLVGFTSSADSYRDHWGSGLIARAVNESKTDRKVRIVVNELLSAVLSTLVAIKQSGRRLVLMQVISKFIVEAKHFENPLFGSGLLGQAKYVEVIGSLNEIVDSDRGDKMINDFIRRIEKTKRTAAGAAGSVSHGTLPIDGYIPNIDFKDIVANAPPLKEIFIRVMLEWNNFSNALKDKMIGVMNEIFKEKRLFDKYLKTSDVLSLGPISVIYNRLKWLKENSELNSLIVRAKYECMVSGVSKSLAKIVNTLEYLTNFCHPRNGASAFIIEKTQNIIRQLGVSKEVMLIWTLVHSLNKMGKGYDTPCIILKSALVSFLYYFVRNNPTNVRHLANMLEPTHYVISIIQYPALLRLINDYNHLAIRDITRLQIYLLDIVNRSDRDLNCLCFFEKLMIDKHGHLKRTSQNVASTLLSERISTAREQFKERYELSANLFELLAIAAEDNTPVITQCRHLEPFSKLQEDMMNEEYPGMQSSQVYFLYTVYVKKLKLVTEAKEVKMLETVDDILEIVEKTINLACERMREPKEVLQLAIDGSYGLVYFYQNPAYTDIHINLPNTSKELQKWTFLCKGWDDRVSGVLISLLSILESVQIDIRVQAMLSKLYFSLKQTLARMESIKQQTTQFLCLDPLMRVLTVSADRTKKLIIKIRGELPLCSEFEEYVIEPGVMQALRGAIAGSLPFTVDPNAGKDLEVDQRMTTVMSNGYKRFTKVFVLENEDDYINAIVSLIDSRLTSGKKFKKNEVKELILSLRSKIRRLQRLFTSSEQRTLFFKIMKGVVPEEENAALKIMLNPLFTDSDLLGNSINAILRHETHDEVLAALSLLHKLFILQSREFMDEFRLSLNRNSWAYPLFMKIQGELARAKAFILEQGTSTRVDSEENALSKMVTSMSKTTHIEEDQPQSQILISMLDFMQICCDNCNEPFQEFYKEQGSIEGKADVDMVTAVANFLIDIRVAHENLMTNENSYNILNSAMAALVDFVTGPCVVNQTLLGNNVRIYLLMNSLIRRCQGDKDEKVIEIHSFAIQFLNTLLEGNPHPSVPETMSKFLNIGVLRQGCEDVYRNFIKGHEEELSLELDSLSEEYHGVVENALQQAIFLIKLKSMGVVHDELNKFEAPFADARFSYGFYAKYTGYVEVNRNGSLEGHFFSIPWKCKYITPNTRNDVIVGVNRASHQEKIEDFLKKVPLCRLEMEHQQRLYCSKTFKGFSARWATFGKVSYYIALLINIVLLFSIERPDFSDLTGNFWAFTAVSVLGVLQILSYMACFFFNLVEYYPQALTNSIPKLKEFEMDDFPKVSHSDSQIMHGLHASLHSNDKRDYTTELQDKLKEVVFNFDMYYTYTYFLLSIIAVYDPVFYSFLLLDMIKQTPELVNVLKSVTQNFRQLILTMWLGVIIVYLFAIGSFVFYSQYYVPDNNLNCDDLWNCFFSTLNMGIRSGGDYMDIPEGPDFWSRMAFDMMFYLIIIIILLNIIFGIIIDTFAELRDKRSQVLEDIHNCCYICGNERSEIELKGSGWSYHFMREHSVFAYLSFLIYITEKKIYDCTGLEKHVKECYIKQDTGFMPETSILMMKKGDEVEIKATDDD